MSAQGYLADSDHKFINWVVLCYVKTLSLPNEPNKILCFCKKCAVFIWPWLGEMLA